MRGPRRDGRRAPDPGPGRPRTLGTTALARGTLPLLALVAMWPGPAPAQEAPAPPEPVVTLLFAGDVMLDDGPGRTVAAGRDPLAALAPVLAAADLAVANLECPISTKGRARQKPWTFRARPGTLAVVKRHFDAVSLANNHSGDYGPAALVDTMDRLAAAGVPFFGAGRDLAAAHAPLILERNGLRIALLGYDDFFPRWFEAGPASPGVAWADDEQAARDIRRAREAGADLVIPFLHWGWEGERVPGARQRELAHRLIDAGADAVVGGHPHATQPAEVYRGRLVLYSLGNLVFDGFGEGPGREGWLLRLTLSRKGLVRWDTVPVRIDDRGTPRPDPAASGPRGDAGEDATGTGRPAP
jgi:poly-gamma-glutamate capsule biosynthesis protein CapA/YwtB (metallophosphatase superfamily)